MKRLLLVAIAALAFASSANAASFGFDCIAGSALACGVGEASLKVDVTDNGGGSVTLKFSNNDAGTSSLTAVYIDDSSLIANASLSGGTGTSFKKGGKPKDLPGAGASFVEDFRFTAKKKKDVNGVNGGESLSIVLTLKGGTTFSDVLTAIANGSLRFGAHISDADPSCVGNGTGPQCEGDPGSASFVNLAVPEPAAAALASVACLGLALIGRRR